MMMATNTPSALVGVVCGNQINYCVSELECLAIIEGTRRYHPYLISRPFTIVTDHVSLTYLNSLKAGKSRLQRSALHLQAYTFIVKQSGTTSDSCRWLLTSRVSDTT